MNRYRKAGGFPPASVVGSIKDLASIDRTTILQSTERNIELMLLSIELGLNQHIISNFLDGNTKLNLRVMESRQCVHDFL
jgi:hypothetical protein